MLLFKCRLIKVEGERERGGGVKSVQAATKTWDHKEQYNEREADVVRRKRGRWSSTLESRGNLGVAGRDEGSKCHGPLCHNAENGLLGYDAKTGCDLRTGQSAQQRTALFPAHLRPHGDPAHAQQPRARNELHRVVWAAGGALRRRPIVRRRPGRKALLRPWSGLYRAVQFSVTRTVGREQE